MRDAKKMLENKIVNFKKIHKFVVDYFFIGVSFFLFIKNVFIKIINLIFPTKYTRCGKNVQERNCLFQRDLRIC